MSDTICKKTSTEWVDILFKDYPCWDDEGIAPKEHSLRTPTLRHRVVAHAKANKFAKPSRRVELRFHMGTDPLKFYGQFTAEELRDVGI